MTERSFIRVVGQGWEIQLPCTDIKFGEQLIRRLIQAREQRSPHPMAIEDADNRLIGLVVPVEIKAATFHSCPVPIYTQDDLVAAQMSMLESQQQFYASHLRDDDFPGGGAGNEA